MNDSKARQYFDRVIRYTSMVSDTVMTRARNSKAFGVIISMTHEFPTNGVAIIC